MNATGADTTRVVRLQLPSDLMPDSEHRGVVEAAQAGLAGVWCELGLRSRPAVRLDAGPGSPLAGVLLDGQPLALSAKRRQAIAVAVTGEPHRAGEPADAETFVTGRAREATAEDRRDLVVSLLCATIRGGMAALVAGEAEALASSWLPTAGAGLVPLAAHALMLAAELGVPPSHLNPSLVSAAAKGSGHDPYRVCEALVSEAVESGRLSPALEFSRSTLRRLTLSSQPLRSSLMAGDNWTVTMPRMIRYESVRTYGIPLPDIALAMAHDLPDDRYRVRFGRLYTACQLVLAEGSVAVEPNQSGPHDHGQSRYLVDPLYGGRWPIFDGPARQPTGADGLPYDPAALVIRGLYAELSLRLAWWRPGSVPALARGGPFSGALLERLRGDIGPVLRWLASDRVTVRHGEQVLEGMVAGYARGDDTVPALVSTTRQVMGAAVLDVTPSRADIDVRSLDPVTIDEAIRANSLAPLLQRHPELLSTVETFVVAVPAAARATVQCLLRPLGDVMLVAADGELADATLRVPAAKWDPDGSR